MRKIFLMAAACLLASPAIAAQKKDEEQGPSPLQILENAPDSAWRSVPDENLIYMQLPAGVVVIELRPDLAPVHAQRIRELTEEKFYDGILFHRVIEGFMAQGGDPKGDGTGGSDKPNIPGEFTHDVSEEPDFVAIGRDRIAPRVGYIDGLPVGAAPESLRTFVKDADVELWPLHCPGVMSMARATDPNSANSQFFLMIGDSRLNLDKRYTVWGRIIDGFEATRRIARGEPPRNPTPIMRMRVGEEAPESQQHKYEVMDTGSPEFMAFIKATGDVDETGFVKDICDIKIPIRVDGKIKR